MFQKQFYWIYVAVVLLLGLANNSVLAHEREYWIAADEVDWDYAPSFPNNLMSGQEFTSDQRVFVEEGIGRIYRKSVYREYTEGFSALKQRGPEDCIFQTKVATDST